MGTTEILELINSVTLSEKKEFLIKIEKAGYIELEKSEVMKILNRKYIDAKLEEFVNWIETKDVNYYELAAKLKIHPAQFSQMINGDVRKNKIVGNTLQFISQVKKLIK